MFSQKRQSKNIKSLEPIQSVASVIPVDQSIPDAQSVLLEYIKKNPRNKKVLQFLKKQ